MRWRTAPSDKGCTVRKIVVGCTLVFALAIFAPIVVRGQSQTTATPAASQQDQIETIDSLGKKLEDISDTLDEEPSPEELAKLKESLPKEWTVTTPEGDYKISTEYLRTQLIAGSTENAETWVDHLESELTSYSQKRSAHTGNPRKELDHILASSEFASVHPPTAWDTFRQRLALWFARLLMRLFGALERYPLGGQILFWVFVVGCVAFIAMWVFRYLISRDRMEELPPHQAALAARTWQEWIRAAREAAARHDFREAVHSAYWAGITRMEDLGVVPKDRSMTPREYLRLVAEPVPAELIPHTRYQEPLARLTTRLERIWYANRGARSEDYQDSLRQLEALGCQLE